MLSYMDFVEGEILAFDKPYKWTSFDVVGKARWLLCLQLGLKKLKVGHTGTLDPMCTGVLPVLTGNYTKLSDYFPSNKAYVCKICLGVVTDTEDITGQILETSEKNISEDEFKSVLYDFIGNINQVPPMYSSIKKNGVPLYKLARKGVQIEREPRSVTVYDIKYNGPAEEKNSYYFTVYCSAGTYIRTICADIGKRLGCGACM